MVLYIVPRILYLPGFSKQIMMYLQGCRYCTYQRIILELLDILCGIEYPVHDYHDCMDPEVPQFHGERPDSAHRYNVTRHDAMMDRYSTLSRNGENEVDLVYSF